jgi:hypothetical protein
MTDGAVSRSFASRISPSRLILFLPIALVLIWLIVRQLILVLFMSSPNSPIPPLWPVSGATVIAQSETRTLNALKGDRASVDSLRRASLDAPLAPDPYYAEAVVRIRRGDRAGAIPLLEQARRREPRWAAPRLMLAQQYLLTGKADGAVAEIAGLTRLGTGIGEQLLDALIPLSKDPTTRPAVIAALRQDTQLRQAFINHAAHKGGDAALLFKSLVSASTGGGSGSEDQAAVVTMLADSGDYQRAYLAWINFLPEKALSGIAFVYDGDFAGLPGPWPFNWRLLADGSGNAELTRKSSLPQGTALEANYFSEQPSTLAEQTIVLEPGSYVFSYSVTASREGDIGGGLGWSLRCIDKQGRELLRSGLLPTRPTRVDVRFAVPTIACAAQKLTLVGTSGDVPATIRAEYSGLTVTRLSRPAPTPTEQGAPS